MDGLVARRGTERMQPTTAIDSATVAMSPWEPATAWVDASGAEGNDARARKEGATHLQIALSDPVEGREAEFNDWYTGRHLPDVLAVPGFVGGQRFKVIPWGAKPAPTRHLAI